MEKIELRELLASFSESEERYANYPETRDEFFKERYGAEIPIFDLTNSVHENKLFQKDTTRAFFKTSAIEFAQHTRFSHPPLHKHKHIEITFVYQGSCRQFIQGKNLTLKQGDLCLLDSNVVHTIYDVGEADIIMNIMLKKSFFNDTFLNRLSNFSLLPSFILNAISEEKVADNFLIFHPKSDKKIKDTFENMLIEYIENDTYSEEAIKSYMVLFFTDMLRNLDANELNKEARTSVVLPILKYIEDHSKSCNLQELAIEFNYHPNYVAQLLREHTGQSFKDILIKQRIKKAEFLLTHTDLSIEEIADEVGYNNLTFFYRKFKEIDHCTPREFRLEHQ